MKRFFHRLNFFPAFVITLFVVLLRPFFKINFVALFSSRIGHYAHQTELMLCAFDLDILKKQKRTKYFFYRHLDPVANTQLDKMWARILPVLPWASLWTRVDQLLGLILGKKYCELPIKYYANSASGQDYRGLMEKINKPHLMFTEAEIKIGQNLLQALGIPLGQKWVCLNVRDSAYLAKQFPEQDWRYHNYRDADIEQYKKAVLFLIAQGYYVIRMGKYVHKKFDLDVKEVIDYANHLMRSDFLDIYLSAHCCFFLSTQSGLDSIAQIFRRPVCLCDTIVTDLQTWYPIHYFISKKIFSNDKKRYLSVAESFMLFKEVRYFTENLFKYNCEIVDNTSEEILDLVKTMLAALEGKYIFSDQDEILQKLFWKIFPSPTTCLDKSEFYPFIKIAPLFLAQNQYLLEQNNDGLL